jgi:hypothetical protein
MEIRQVIDRISRWLKDLFLPLVPTVSFLWLLIILPRIGQIGQQASRERRNLLLWLALGMWLLPILGGYMVSVAQLIKDRIYAAGISPAPLPRYLPDLGLLATSFSYCMLAPLVYGSSFRPAKRGSARWFRYLAFALAALSLSGGVILLEGYILQQWLALILMSLLVLGVWTWLSLELCCPGGALWRELLSSWSARFGLVAGLTLLAYPFTAAVHTISATEGWQLRYWTLFYFILGPLLLPYSALAALIPILRDRLRERMPVDKLGRNLGRLVFAVFVVGFLGAGLGTSQWFALNLIPFLLAAVWIFPLLLKPPAWGESPLAARARKELDKRPVGPAEMRRRQWEAREEAKRAAKQEKAGGGAKPPEQATEGVPQTHLARMITAFMSAAAKFWSGRAAKPERPREPETSSGQLPEDYDTRRVIFAFGPSKDFWENVMLACRYGAVLTTALFLAYLPLILERADQLINTPFPLLQMLGVLVLPFFARWILASFLLGCFFPWIRGATGLQKGLVLGAGIVACTLPSNILFLSATTDTLLALLWDAVQTILFLTFLGLWAFDVNTIKRYGLGWKDLLREHGLSFVVSYLSIIGGAIGTAATTVVTGQFEAVVRSALTLSLRGAPPLLGGGG